MPINCIKWGYKWICKNTKTHWSEWSSNVGHEYSCKMSTNHLKIERFRCGNCFISEKSSKLFGGRWHAIILYKYAPTTTATSTIQIHKTETYIHTQNSISFIAIFLYIKCVYLEWGRKKTKKFFKSTHWITYDVMIN